MGWRRRRRQRVGLVVDELHDGAHVVDQLHDGAWAARRGRNDNEEGNYIEAENSKLKAWNLGNPKTFDFKKPGNPRKSGNQNLGNLEPGPSTAKPEPRSPGRNAQRGNPVTWIPRNMNNLTVTTEANLGQRRRRRQRIGFASPSVLVQVLVHVVVQIHDSAWAARRGRRRQRRRTSNNPNRT